MENANLPQPEPGAIGRITGKARSVLLLEDEGAFNDLIKSWLENNGCAVTCVPNGVEGLKQVMAQDFDVIICDMMMPNLPGDMFYIAVDRIKPHLCRRFIFISGYKGEAKIDQFIRKIGGVVLWKPFEPSDLFGTMQLVLRTNNS